MEKELKQLKEYREIIQKRGTKYTGVLAIIDTTIDKIENEKLFLDYEEKSKKIV